MTPDFARHCAEIVAQTKLLTGHMDGADPTVPVPTCPGRNVSQLLRHIDGGQHWAAQIVGTRASEPPPHTALALGREFTLDADVAADTNAHWLLDLTGAVIAWWRAGDASPVFEVTGDAGLVDFWLERVGFG